MLSLIILTLANLPAGVSFSCTPIAVWDGDGPIWCAEGPRIRLAGVAAREIDGSCRRERYADYGQVGFLVWMRADVQLAHKASFSRLKSIIPAA